MVSERVGCMIRSNRLIGIMVPVASGFASAISKDEYNKDRSK